MNSHFIKKTLASAFLAVSALNANATTITFDDISVAGSDIMPAEYQGLYWSPSWLVIDRATYPVSGYSAGTVSGSNTALNGWDDTVYFSSTTTFTLDSLYATAAWRDDLQVTFTGSAGGVSLYQMTVSPSATAATQYTFNWSGIDRVTMSTTGGTYHLGYELGHSGGQVAIDNISINANVAAVPEPETYAMMLAGVGALGFMNRRRRREN